MNTEHPIDIALPEQNLVEFPHFPLWAEAARTWAGQLPVTNIRAVSEQLLSAVRDLNRHPLGPEERYRVLEALADNLRVTLANLNRRFLNQPLVMTAEPRKLAEITGSLLAELHIAYATVAVETLAQQEHIHGVNPARLMCQALHRAIFYAGRGILLAFQLHRPAPRGSWRALHQLYALAEWQGLTQLPVPAGEGRTDSVQAAYLQALLTGCCKPNQLRQSGLLAVHEALAQWGSQLRIGKAYEVDGLFVVDFAGDRPATYSALLGEAKSSQRHIDTTPLVALLRDLKTEDDASGRRGVRLQSGTVLPSSLLGHLIEALGTRSMRNFKRMAVDAPVLVCLGLSGVHYHAEGERSFAQLLYGQEHAMKMPDAAAANPFLPRQRPRGDIWSQANPERDYFREESGIGQAALTHNIELETFTGGTVEAVGTAAPAEQAAPVYRVRQVNSSPGGYCIEWSDDPPEDLLAGNIASIQEQPQANWSIGVIRWVTRLETTRTLVGLELLSPQATAYGVFVQTKRGGQSTPQRALILPEIKLVAQPPTLVTPRTGFREGLKVSLLRHGEIRHLQLQRLISATASYAQFEYREVRQLGDVLGGNNGGPPSLVYDSVWNHI